MRVLALVITGAIAIATPARQLHSQQFDRTRDRGPGQPTSMFATYIERGQFLLYPFFEYYHDKNAEYKPQELGYTLDQDFRGRFHASEALLFVAYGFTDRFAIEFEIATINARLQKSADDPSTMPAILKESGLGDVEGQLRWRWNRETDSKPEYFTYFETVFPSQKDKLLIGTADYEFKLGTGLTRGFSWGTAAFRAAIEYDAAEKKGGMGELAIEYIKRVSSRVGIYTGVEGAEDEWEWIAQLQLGLPGNVTLKLNNALGVTSKATDWAPEVGLMLSFR